MLNDIDIPRFQLNQLRDYIYNVSGIFVDEQKDYFLIRRIEGRMDELQIETFTDYYRHLAFDKTGVELSALINDVTVNETSFFRDYFQLSGFAENVLPMLLDEKEASGDRSLNILSAGCSTGEEPYTIAIILKDMIENIDQWNIRIDAFDINTHVLEACEQARYTSRSTRDVPLSYKVKYFHMEDDALQLKEEVKNMVEFKRGNLIDESAFLNYDRVDILFCRNVLIYFDNDSRRTVISHLYNSLRPGGFIFLGYSESVGRVSGAFELMRFNDFMCYRRPLKNS